MAENISGDECDKLNSEKINIFLQIGCGCSLGRNGSSCCKLFTRDVIERCRDSILELSTSELDMVIMTQLHCSYEPRCESQQSKRTVTNFQLYGETICRRMFFFIYDISLKKFENLKKNYHENGLAARIHGNTKNLHHSYSLNDYLRVRLFIENYAEENAVLLPGRIPGYKCTKIVLLPSAESKHDIWRFYKLSAEKDRHPAVGFVTFCNLWNQTAPYIVVAKPMTDLCWVCQENNTALYRSMNNSEEEKQEKLVEQLKHIKEAKSARQYYDKQLIESARVIADNNLDLGKRHMPCSFQGTMHYSFDYAQQLHYPTDPFQPGPIYFKTCRKCAIFGVCIDGIPLQYNYLIDECMDTGKGANSTISYLHSFLRDHGLGETDVKFHADNCTGQNKNNTFMHYLLWRVITERHREIEYSFMIAGHTKFACDGCFGVLKSKVKKSFVSSVYDIYMAVEKSSEEKGCNMAELVGTHDGKVMIKCYDWTRYMSTYFKKLEGIKKYHHFTFSHTEPGYVSCRENLNSEPYKICLLKNVSILPSIKEFPHQIPPKGLAPERKEYLFKEIRKFCKPGTEDFVGPDPNL